MIDANADRGEISIELEGVPHVLRPSFTAQVAIERLTGQSLEQLAAAAGADALSLDAAATIVTECVRAQGKATGDQVMANYNQNRVGELIAEAGKMAVVRRLELLLFMAVTGGYTAAGELRPLPTKAPSPAAGATEAGTAA